MQKKPILIISGAFGAREVFDTEDALDELQDAETEDILDREDLEERG